VKSSAGTPLFLTIKRKERSSSILAVEKGDLAGISSTLPRARKEGREKERKAIRSDPGKGIYGVVPFLYGEKGEGGKEKRDVSRRKKIFRLLNTSGCKRGSLSP